jgi:hypothetical protein
MQSTFKAKEAHMLRLLGLDGSPLARVAIGIVLAALGLALGAVLVAVIGGVLVAWGLVSWVAG